MQIIKTKFRNLLIFKKPTHNDKRGNFKEIYLKKKFNKKFIFHLTSKSNKNVIRGLHIQIKKPQGKFISVLNGKIFDVCLDLRKKSKTFGKVYKIILDSKFNKSIYVPEGFAHGFKSLSNNTIVHYMTTNYRSINHEKGILWNDKTLNIRWPNIKKNIVSKKDSQNHTFLDFVKEFSF